MKILFVCLGNICRSPAAEGIMKAVVARHEGTEAGQAGSEFVIDSAGTYGGHAGELPDPRMRQAAHRRGLVLDSLARQFSAQDFEVFDLIVCMDQSNQSQVQRLAPDDRAAAKVTLMTQFSRRFNAAEVPDPYFGGPAGFDHVLDLLEDACQGLWEHLKST